MMITQTGRTMFQRGNGAGDRIRTGDIDLGKVALYQLSYSRRAIFIVARRIRVCQTILGRRLGVPGS
jgi:hypothetical protein